jgi:hypothetical protein
VRGLNPRLRLEGLHLNARVFALLFAEYIKQQWHITLISTRQTEG